MTDYGKFFNLNGRVALLYLPYGKIGELAADTLAALGAGIALVGNDAKAANRLRGKLAEKYSIPCEFMEVDPASEDELAALPAAVAETMGSLDLLVTITDIHTEELNSPVFAKANPLFLIRAAIPLLQKGQHGQALNISCVSATEGGSADKLPTVFSAFQNGLIKLLQVEALQLEGDLRLNSIKVADNFISQPGHDKALQNTLAWLASDLALGISGNCITLGDFYF